MEPGRITNQQLTFLMTLVLLSSVVIFMPQVAARGLENDAWLSGALATVWGIVVVWVLLALGRRFPDKTIIEYLPIILGKPLGKIVGFMYAFWFITISAFILRYFGMFLNITIMPNTPVMIFSVTLIFLSLYAMRNGMESWVRVSEIILPLVIIVMLAVIFLSYGNFDFRKILPIGEHSPGSVIVTSLSSGSWRGEVLILAMFLPSVKEKQHIGRNLTLAVIVVGLILTGAEMVMVGVFGGINTGDHEFPFFSLARMIAVGRVFDRIEILVVLGWVLGIFIKICAFLYSSIRATAQLAGFKDYQFLVFPITILILALSDNIMENVAEGIYFLSDIWAGYGLITFELVIPLLLLFIAVIRNKRTA